MDCYKLGPLIESSFLPWLEGGGGVWERCFRVGWCLVLQYQEMDPRWRPNPKPQTYSFPFLTCRILCASVCVSGQDWYMNVCECVCEVCVEGSVCVFVYVCECMDVCV